MTTLNSFQTTSILLAVLFVVAFSHNAASQVKLTPPTAVKQETKLENHGITRIDPYYWLCERDNPKVIDYLNAENAYAEAALKELEPLEATLYDEFKQRIKQDDASVPYLDRGFVYYNRYEEGKQYPIYCRKSETEEAVEEVILDVNELAKGKAFCSVLGLQVSPDSKLLAFGVDFTGRRKYSLQFKNLETGEMLDDQVDNVTGSCVWANDSKTVFFTRKDPQTLRAYLVVRHRLMTSSEQDVVVFEETDEEFSCGVRESRSREYIFIDSNQTLSTEVRFLDADKPDGEFRVFHQRRPDHEYSVDHLGDTFFIYSNEDAPNFRLFTANVNAHTRADWMEKIPHRNDVFLQSFALFDDYLVLSERRNGLTHLRVLGQSPTSSVDYDVPVSESVYVATASPTPEPSTDKLRFRYTSLVTPNQVIEFDMRTQTSKVLKEDEVLGGFQRANYKTERLWATAMDGTAIPVSVVYHRDTPLDGTAPCLQYGYGSYGASMEPRFSSNLLSLLDRGFVYAIAHIRGGQEMGREWYEDGKLLRKMNTFTDFIDVGNYLVEQRIANPESLYCRGGSAGGLLIGAVINLSPELYTGAIADVPFVDVVTTMLDDSIPLTTFEYDEWGNPNEREYFEYMLSYSPYDQVRTTAYPHLLVTTGLHDSQVQYWEPAKWVAKIRALNPNNQKLLLLKTNMEAGHGGATGRYDRLKLDATRYAFLLKLAGKSSN